jgi:hypothetical protein
MTDHDANVPNRFDTGGLNLFRSRDDRDIGPAQSLTPASETVGRVSASDPDATSLGGCDCDVPTVESARGHVGTYRVQLVFCADCGYLFARRVDYDGQEGTDD